MKIVRFRSRTALAALVVIAGSASAQAASNSEVEVMTGWYSCGIGQDGQGIMWTSFQATGDFLPEYFSLQREIHSTGSPQETCAALAGGIHQIVQAAGCSVGPHRTSTTESGASNDFAFVCHDQRSRLKDLLADVGAATLTASP